MKNLRFTSILGPSLITCALTIGTLVSSASAQGTTAVAEVNIPFAFQTPTRTMPAGTYRIDSETTHLILLRGPGRAAEFVVTQDSFRFHAADHGSVVFDRYGNQYFLRRIWKAGDTMGLECPKSRAEKEAEKGAQLAKNKQTPDLIELAFNSAPKH
jgi:hypothetical protein